MKALCYLPKLDSEYFNQFLLGYLTALDLFHLDHLRAQPTDITYNTCMLLTVGGQLTNIAQHNLEGATNKYHTCVCICLCVWLSNQAKSPGYEEAYEDTHKDLKRLNVYYQLLSTRVRYTLVRSSAQRIATIHLLDNSQLKHKHHS